MCPLHVQTGLEGPARRRASHAVVELGCSFRIDDLNGRAGQTEGIAESVQISLHRGTAICIHDHDGLAVAGRALGVQRIHPVRRVNVGRCIAVKNGGTGMSIRVDARVSDGRAWR